MDIHWETPGVHLIQNDDKSIAGVIAKDPEGSYIRVLGTKGTLLATGSYDHNPDLLKAWVRPRDLSVSAYLNTTLTDTGDGHLMGLAVGAAGDEIPHPVMNDSSGARDHTAYSAAVLSVLRVNDSGVRYVNEDLTLNYLANAIAHQHGGHAWCICDANISPMAQHMMGDAPFAPDAMTDAFIANSVECANIEELAAAIGCDVETIQATLDRYNEMCDTGEDTDFHKSAQNLVRVDTPPYYAFEERPAMLVTVGGLHVNNHSQVLDANDQPIAGLYATGNVSGSMFADTYPHHVAGVSTGRCLTFGYLLGRRLAGVEE